MLKNPAPPSWNSSSPMTNYSKGRSSYVAPSPQLPPPQPKYPLKRSEHFQITITVRDSVTGTLGEQVSPKDKISVMFFDYAEQNGYLKILIR